MHDSVTAGNGSFFLIHCEVMFYPSPEIRGCFTSWEVVLRLVFILLRRQPDSFLLTPLFLIGVLLSSLSKFCVSDEVVYLSLSEKSLMYRSSDSVTTFGLPDQALDINYPVSAKSFRVPCTFLLETFSLAKIWCRISPSLPWIIMSSDSLSFHSQFWSHVSWYCSATKDSNVLLWTSHTAAIITF